MTTEKHDPPKSDPPKHDPAKPVDAPFSTTPPGKSDDKPAKPAPQEHAGKLDNRDQDPNDPANKTLSPGPGVPPPPPPLAADAFSTEQEKDKAGGVGPASPSENSPGPAKTMEDLGIGPRTPYPTGNPPKPDETVTKSQAVKGATDSPKTTPSEDHHPVRK